MIATPESFDQDAAPVDEYQYIFPTPTGDTTEGVVCVREGLMCASLAVGGMLRWPITGLVFVRKSETEYVLSGFSTACFDRLVGTDEGTEEEQMARIKYAVTCVLFFEKLRFYGAVIGLRISDETGLVESVRADVTQWRKREGPDA